MLVDANAGSDAPQGRQRLSSAARRRAILDAAIELFARKGFRGTTTRELSTAIGVSEPVLYQHFATKRDLYTAIVDHMTESAAESFKQAFADHLNDDELQFFTWLGTEIVAFHEQSVPNIRLLYFSALEGHEFADLWHERATSQFIAYVRDFVQRRIDAGAFRLVNPDLATFFIMGACAQYGVTSNLFHCPIPGAPRAEVVRQFVDLFLNGIRPRSN